MPRWIIDLSAAAERDFGEIMSWTAQTFGVRQAKAYAKLIDATLEKLARDPLALPSRARDDELGPGLRTIHVAARRGASFYTPSVATASAWRAFFTTAWMPPVTRPWRNERLIRESAAPRAGPEGASTVPIGAEVSAR